MRGLTQTGLEARFAARMDARLERDVAHPLAVALSGGGDSMALLGLAADWARRRGRRLVAITVDHGLNPESLAWSALCRQAAGKAGAGWIERVWHGDKPTTGLPAAARAARHALIAEAARTVGARVVLFAHTADDLAEADWMRARGSTLGSAREWSPSPAWPEGREQMLLRPLLGEARDALRGWLSGRGADWIEDPANTDDRFARSRARRVLIPLPAGEGLRLVKHSDGPAEGMSHDQPLTLSGSALPFGSRKADRLTALGRSIPLPLGEGFVIDRSVKANALATILLCAAGTTIPPRNDRLAGLLARWRSGETFTATLAGARVVAAPDTVLIGREPGRTPCPETALPDNIPTVWDGRYEITVPRAGYTVRAASGCLNRLSDADRRLLKTVAACLRPTVPVLIRDDGSDPVLAGRVATVKALAPRRLALTLGETTHERDLSRTIHGEMPQTDLFSIKELHKGDPSGSSRD